MNWNTALSFSPHRTRLGTIIIAIVFVLLSLFCKCLESFGDLLKVTCPGNIKSRNLNLVFGFFPIQLMTMKDFGNRGNSEGEDWYVVENLVMCVKSFEICTIVRQ